MPADASTEAIEKIEEAFNTDTSEEFVEKFNEGVAEINDAAELVAGLTPQATIDEYQEREYLPGSRDDPDYEMRWGLWRKKRGR
jgi:hypothetical protein